MSSCHIGCIICIGCLCLLSNAQLGSSIGEVAQSDPPVPHICRSKDIRNKVVNFAELENCTVIEGYLKILLIDRAGPEEYDGLTFPKLVEITGYLLLYRVFGLKTLRGIFPNLAVIRGQELFFDYALVAFEMPNLEELGLVRLTTIQRGAVRLEKNSNLCYIDTIDWGLIVSHETSSEDHFFAENRNADECVNVCPRDRCPIRELDEKRRICWTSLDCQIACPRECPTKFCNTSILTSERKSLCCHEQCIGGCYGEGPMKCVACKNFFYKGRCQPKCPPSTYEFWDRRCIQEQECKEMQKIKRPNITRWKTFDGKCIKNCPVGYTEDDTVQWKCKKCEGPCPKECSGTKIESIATAQRLKGCTVIKGYLEIQIRGGKNIAKELEENLGLIEVVSGYVRIARSHALISLNFLKSLKVIKGKRKQADKYSLFVVDNQNLQEIWNFTTHPNLTIESGRIFFHFNSKLCLDKIYRLANQVGIKDKQSADISPKTNGDQVACNISKLQIIMTNIGGRYLVMKWKPFTTIADHRELIGYTISYREAPEKNISIYSERDACGNAVTEWKSVDIIINRYADLSGEGDGFDRVTVLSTIDALREAEDLAPDLTMLIHAWKMEDIINTNPSYVYHILTGLEPWTQYAVYVQTYTVASSNEGAMSELVYFKTDPEVPTHPRDVLVNSPHAGELHVRWKEPLKPNGNVTHYYVYWSPQPVRSEDYDRRDYCTYKLKFLSKSSMKVKEDNPANKTLSGKCCACPKTPKEKRIEEDERKFQIEFENYLHNYVYQKRPVGSTAVSARKRSKRETAFLRTGLNNDVSNTSLVIYGNQTDDEEEDEEDGYLAAIVYNKREIILPNLRHFQTYSIEVVACQEYDPVADRKYCSNRAIITATTRSSDLADNVDDRTVNVTSSATGIHIMWADPVSPNGLVITYEIEYYRNNVGNIKKTTICIPHKTYRVRRGYRLDNSKLPPGNYTYRIRATSLAGNGTWTRPMNFTVVDLKAEDDEFWKPEMIALIVCPVLLVFILTAAGLIWFFVKKKLFPGVPDGMYISVNPEYMNTEGVYEPDEWEVDRDKIKLIRELGQGSFGMVYEGVGSGLKSESDPDKPIPVAVKTVNESASMRDRIEFLNEASVMKAFCCNHVVKLLGVVSKGQPTLVVMELMANGDLKNYLRIHRPDVEDNEGRKPPGLKRILQMAGEIADGMAYLAAKKFVHRDLAARNCMVAEGLTVKIGDFGMTRDIYERDYYKKGGRGLLPVRWMAPESLKDGVFTSTSDVWSYGVVLWEMATLAAQPYQGLSNEQVLKFVIDKGLMEKPEGCPEKLFDLMCLCWKYNSKQRPTFNEIIEILVPDLSPEFSELSYFFSESNRRHDLQEAAEECCPLTGTEDTNPEAIMMAELNCDSVNEADPEMGLPCNHISNSPTHGNSSRNSNYSDSKSKNKQKEKRPKDCALNQSSPSTSNRNPNCSVSSPSSSDGSKSDGSKASMRSNGSAYSHMNGLANGHVNSPIQQLTEC
ncbi:insulin-like peptide receptor isoform X2 [Lineus longissimus]|uniref:insulin-like peptide receptor isoform X2 n=1 Tax=Lineus longissimus TaxID=88925 RepID=UPI00315D3C6E